jgi:hypothetical protein
MSKSSETTTGTTTGTSSDTTTSSGTGTGGSGGTPPHPRRTLEIVLLFIVLAFTIYNTYTLMQHSKILQSLPLTR